MDASGRKRLVRAVILLGAVYFVVGIAFAAFARWSASNQMQTAWRLAAWLISAIAFAGHIWYERLRLRNSALTTALHTSMAAALGAFALAVAANIHRQQVASSHQRLLGFSLVAWPVLTAVPAFVVALLAAAGLGLRRSA
jgi:uncharacterized protein (DUF486 family)